MITQTPRLDFSIHKVQPGDKVLVKSWREDSLTPRWEEPFLVLLMTEIAMRSMEKGWKHLEEKRQNLENNLYSRRLEDKEHQTTKSSTGCQALRCLEEGCNYCLFVCIKCKYCKENYHCHKGYSPRGLCPNCLCIEQIMTSSVLEKAVQKGLLDQSRLIFGNIG